MEIIIKPTPEAATKTAARIIARLLKKKPNAVLGLASGNTPLLLYRELIEMQLDWRKVTTFNLDECMGLQSEGAQSYHSFMWENLFRHVNIPNVNVHIPNGTSTDVPRFCDKYAKQIRAAGGIDLQVLTIGTDEHIDFGEPRSSLASRTCSKTMPRQTQVITMGVGTIIDARQNLLLALGKQKAKAIAEVAEGPVTDSNPAFILQMHTVAKLCLDRDAASHLRRKDNYCGFTQKAWAGSRRS